MFCVKFQFLTPILTKLYFFFNSGSFLTFDSSLMIHFGILVHFQILVHILTFNRFFFYFDPFWDIIQFWIMIHFRFMTHFWIMIHFFGSCSFYVFWSIFCLNFLVKKSKIFTQNWTWKKSVLINLQLRNSFNFFGRFLNPKFSVKLNWPSWQNEIHQNWSLKKN